MNAELNTDIARVRYSPCPSCLLGHDPLGPCTAEDAKDARLSVERLPSEEPDLCPVDDLACYECPSYCLEEYPETLSNRPAATAAREADDA